ncbi:hypothetical protein STPH1_6464 [Streptomyces sp. OM5714]|nr:hypothetical protein STPH1_6464 [Streptomyces sp. OM5714]
MRRRDRPPGRPGAVHSGRDRTPGTCLVTGTYGSGGQASQIAASGGSARGAVAGMCVSLPPCPPRVRPWLPPSRRVLAPLPWGHEGGSGTLHGAVYVESLHAQGGPSSVTSCAADDPLSGRCREQSASSNVYGMSRPGSRLRMRAILSEGA